MTEQAFPPELVPKNARPRIKLGDVQILMVELPPGYQAGNCSHTHEGEEWITVLTGKVKVTQGDFTAILEAGDSIHWDGSYPHLCQNAADIPTKILVGLTPPSMLPLEKME